MNTQNGSAPIRSVFADDPDMFELVQMFVSDMPEKITQMRSLWEQSRLNELARIAHQLKGASGGYGFDPLGKAAARLEDTLKSQQTDLDQLKTHLDELVDLCSRAAA